MAEKKQSPDKEPKLNEAGELEYPEEFGWPEAVDVPKKVPAKEPSHIEEPGALPEQSVPGSAPEADLEWPEDVPLLESQHVREPSIRTPFSEDLERGPRADIGADDRAGERDESPDLLKLEGDEEMPPEPWEASVRPEMPEAEHAQFHETNEVSLEKEETEPEPELEPSPAPEMEPPAEERIRVKPDPKQEQTIVPGMQLGYPEEWKIRRPGSYPDFVLDDGIRKYFFHGSRVREFQNVQELNSYLIYMAEFPEAEGSGLLDVAGEVKFAEVLGRKRLEEQGILTPEGSLHLYYKRKKSKNETSLFYNVLPKNSYDSLRQSYMEYKPGFILYDSLGFLYALLQALPAKKTHALAMRVGESIVLVAGRGKEVYLGTRYALLGDSFSNISEGLASLKRDLELGRGNLAAKIQSIQWIESGTETLDWQPPQGGIPVEIWPVARLSIQDRMFYSALPLALKKIGTSAALGPREETWLRPLEKLEKWLWLFLIVLIAIAGLGTVYLGNMTQTARETLVQTQHQAEAVEQSQPALPEYSTEGVQQTLVLARSLEAAARAPAVSMLWNALARAKDETIRMNRVEMKYEADAVDVILGGTVELDIDGSQQVYNAFLARLEGEGYTIDHENLQIDLEGNNFDIGLRYPAQSGEDR